MNVFEALMEWRASDRPLDAIGSLQDGALAAFSGMENVEATPAQAVSAFLEQGATTADISAAIQQIRSQIGDATAAYVPFSTRPNASTIGPDFAQYYDGSGTGTMGIIDGQVALNRDGSDDRTCIAPYLGAVSASNSVNVGVTYASAPNWFNSSARAINYILARVSDDHDTYVRAELSKYTLAIRAVVDGSPPIELGYRNIGFTFKANSTYWLETGVGGVPGDMRIMEGATPVLEVSDDLGVSAWGEDYRGGGIGAFWRDSPVGYNSFARMTSFAMTGIETGS